MASYRNLYGKWRFKDRVALTYNGIKTIDFTSNGAAYTGIKFEGYYEDMSHINSDWKMYYLQGEVATLVMTFGSEWVDEAFRIIDFGYKPKLFLVEFVDLVEANAERVDDRPEVSPGTFDLATLGLTGTHSITVKARANGYADSPESEAVSYVVASAEITDLTGTTWFIPAGWTAASRYGAFSVDWTDQLLDYESDGDFWLGYNENEIWDAGFNNWWDNSTSLCPTFHRGEDVTNPSLISWLKEHGINVTGKTLITFTIDGTTYCAESGMTWGEWCESEYNTNARIGVKSTGYIGWDAEYEGDAHASVYGFTEQDYIVANDPITADGEYVVEASHTGGSNH